jgi:hypothetical protein
MQTNKKKQKKKKKKQCVPEGSVDLVIDIQCLHIFASFEERRRLADLIYK